jgi:hypothetical protein
VVLTPEEVEQVLAHLARVWRLHDNDLRNGLGRAPPPDAL